MKKRNGFVSNSSSSSFICNICGSDASGWDLSHEDADMYGCVNDHLFCTKHVLKVTAEELYKYRKLDAIKRLAILEKEEKPSSWYINCLAELLKEIEKDIKELEEDDFICKYRSREGEDEYSEIVKILCPLCMNKEYSKAEALEVLIKKHNFEKEDILKLIKESRETNV